MEIMSRSIADGPLTNSKAAIAESEQRFIKLSCQFRSGYRVAGPLTFAVAAAIKRIDEAEIADVGTRPADCATPRVCRPDDARRVRRAGIVELLGLLRPARTR